MVRTKDIVYSFFKNIGDKIDLDLPYFVKNGFWVTLRQIVGMISGLALSIAFARLATQEVFGQYQLVLSILSIVSILSLPGLNTAIIQSVAKGYEGDYKKVIKTSFLWSLLGVPTLLIIGGYYYIYQSHPLGIALMISSVFFPFFYAPNTWDSFLQGKSRFDISTKYSSIQAIINTLATTGVIFFSRNGLLPILIIYLLSYTFFNGYYYFKSLKYIENIKTDKDTIKYGWFLTRMNILGLVADNVDKILLATFFSPSVLAAYYLISMLPLKMKDMLKPFLNLFFPKFVTTEGDLKTVIREKKRILFFYILLTALAAIIYYFLIEKINYLFFGQGYEQYYFYSKYFIVVFLIFVPLDLLGRYARAKRMDHTILISDTSYYVTKILLTVVFVLWLGIWGAVIAYNLSMLMWFCLYLINLTKTPIVKLIKSKEL